VALVVRSVDHRIHIAIRRFEIREDGSVYIFQIFQICADVAVSLFGQNMSILLCSIEIQLSSFVRNLNVL
jgi:hypothetical protein